MSRPSWADDPEIVEPVLTVAQGLACGTTFLACTLATQALLGAARISAAKLTAIPTGLLAVFAASAAASVVADQTPQAVADHFGLTRKWRWSQTRHEPGATFTRAVQHGIIGVVLFHLLGGRPNALAPSNVARLGAFHRHRASLQANLDYAGAFDRGKIASFGRSLGCHTCGTRRAADYIADHMPPIKVATQLNKRWWRRVTGIKVVQRYVPQCKTCSGIQSGAVRADKTRLVYHFLSFRLYHATGLFLPAAHEASTQAGLWPREVTDPIDRLEEFLTKSMR